MKKFVKLFLLCTIIFATSLIGFRLDYVSAEQTDSGAFASTSLPTSYDLRDYISIGVENQNPYGICYAYASLTSLETYLALTYGEYYDFSEIHFAVSLYLQSGYYDSIDDALYDGGNFTHFALYTQKDKSIVLEEEMPMSKYLNLGISSRYSTMESDFNNINNNFYPIVKVNDTKSFEQIAGDKSAYTSTRLANFRNSVKSHIMTYGSLTAGIHTNASFSSKTVNYKITDGSLVKDQNTIIQNTNHLISIVGWDDNYDANGTWNNKGAYICLNSWGTGFGEGGYFYVSYDDYFIESNIQGVVDASLCTTNNQISTIKNYQDNTFIITHTLNEHLYVANIFDTTNYIGENITYIDTYVKGGNTKFYVKFFNNKDSALQGLNTITTMNLKQSIKVGEYSLYNKYKFGTPIAIDGNVMVVVTEIEGAYKTHSLGGYASNNLTIELTYYTINGLGRFDTSTKWNPSVDGQDMVMTLPLVLHTDKQYIECSSFNSELESFVDLKYIKNNAIFYNKTISFDLTTTIDENVLNSIKVIRPYANNFEDVTANFEITYNSNSINIKMINEVNSNFSSGNYIIQIPCGDTTIYRVIEVQDVVTYTITYNLNGGDANNPIAYTNKHTSLKLNPPTKAGYAFAGWYLDSDFTLAFDANNLPYTNLTLYAKYNLASPSITSKSNNVSVTYYDGLKVDISISAEHGLESDLNTLSYQWYMRKSLNDSYTIVEGATTPNLSLYTVSQSGYYACEVSINITDTNLVTEPTTLTLSPSANNEILVNIKPYIYDMSHAKWNYTEAISYDTNIHTVQVINLPEGVTVQYSNNEFSEIGTYTAHAELIYNNMDGNAIANPIGDLNWEIRRAKITITIDDIMSEEPLSTEILSFMYSCSIENEYLPSNVVTLQDKINYLELVYTLKATSQPYIKKISATTKQFDIYDITIVLGEYRVVVYTLANNNVTTTSDKGFVKDCTFSATTAQISNEINNILNDKNLILIDAYTLTYSYLPSNESATINIPIDKKILLNDLSVYKIKDNKLIKVDNAIFTADGVTFTTSEQNANYIIVQEDNAHNSNAQMLILICLISIIGALIAYAIVSAIKHKHKHN